MVWQHFKADTILALHAAVVKLGLSENDIDTALAGIHRQYVATLPRGAAPSSRLYATLQALNEVETLNDGSVPMELFLKGILAIHGTRTEAAPIRQAVAVLEQRKPRKIKIEKPHRPPPPPADKHVVPGPTPSPGSGPQGKGPRPKIDPPGKTILDRPRSRLIVAGALAGGVVTVVVAALLASQTAGVTPGPAIPSGTAGQTVGSRPEGTGAPPLATVTMTTKPASCPPAAMALVPKGRLQSHPDDDASIKDTDVPPFRVDVREVTVAEYTCCVRMGICQEPRRSSSNCNYGNPKLEDYPINCVTWSEAVTYCQFQQKQLPTVEQWELVARGSDKRLYPWGKTEPAKVVGLCGEKTCPTSREHQDQTPSRAYSPGVQPSVRDLGGNVKEWTASSACTGKQPSCERHWVLGGEWHPSSDGFRIGSRMRATDDKVPQPDIGFRCVASVAER